MERIKLILLLLICFGMSFTVFSQELEKFKWKNRIVVVEDSDYESVKVVEQVKLLSNVEEALYERKVIVVQSGEKEYRIAHKKSDRNSDDTKPAKFRVMLIGLDGGVKFESDKVVDPQVLIDLIDSMPMRRAEMRRKGN